VCPNNYCPEKFMENWYGKPDSLLAQTLQKKTGKEKILLLGKIPYGLAN
jgi:hypothetical protein